MELVAGAAWTGDPKPTATWAWQRCVKATGACTAIAGASAPRYKVVEADVGTFLRVRVKVTNVAGSVTAQSKPTTVVLAAPTPTPTRDADRFADGDARADRDARADGRRRARPGGRRRRRRPSSRRRRSSRSRSNPFPVVRIKGQLTANGARVTLLTVRAPRDVRIDVDCTGSDCPARHYTAPAGKHRLRKFERVAARGDAARGPRDQAGLHRQVHRVRHPPPRRAEALRPLPGAGHDPTGGVRMSSPSPRALALRAA